MAKQLGALGFFAVMGLITIQAADAAPDAYTVKIRKPACPCQAQAMHHTAIRRAQRSYRHNVEGLAWAQSIDDRSFYVAPPELPPVPVQGPTYEYNFYTTNYYGPPPVPPSGYYAEDYYGYGGLPPADEAARLDPWHGYDPYNGLENGY